MGALRFTILSDACIRIEHGPTGRFVNLPTLMTAGRTSTGAPTPTIIQDVPGDPGFSVSTPRLTLTFTPRGEGPTPASLCVEVRGPFAPGGPAGTSVIWRPGTPQAANLGGTLSTLDGLRSGAPLPDGLLSRDGWVLIDDSGNPILKDGWLARREDHGLEGNTDWYLLAYGRDFAGGLRAFTDIAGRVPMPRRYALGSWYSRYWPHTSEDYRRLVDEYDTNGVPLDVMVLDMDWHREGWTGWSWNRELLPDAEVLLAWLHKRGLAVTLNLHPADGVGPHEDRYAEFMRALGRNPAEMATAPFDAGDRRYMEALFQHVHRPLENGGVDFWWLDWQQDRVVRSYSSLTNLAWLNHLYMLHTRGDRPAGARGLSFSRWAGDETHSDHRNPIHFSGDAHTGWEMLAFQVPFTATAGNAGCFFWSHDIGGHFGPRFEETTARWIQFGALSPALRLHSARNAILDRRPWTYEPRFFEAMKAAFLLRSELMPYLYTQVRDCCAESIPLLRPMYLGFPDQPEAFRRPSQYLFGAHLLAAPIVSPGLGERCVGTQAVWFPPAEEGGSGSWYRWSTGERHSAGDEAVVGASIDEVPLFVRGGVPIPLQPPRLRMTSGTADMMIVRLWPGEPGTTAESTLYEDDGLTRGYETGQSAMTAFTAEWSAGSAPGLVRVRLTIGGATGGYPGLPARRNWRFEFAATTAIERAHVNGHPGRHVSEDHRLGGLAVLETANIPLHEPQVVEVELRPADAEQSFVRHAARRLSEATGWQPAPAAASLAGELRRTVADLARPDDPAADHAGAAMAIGLGIGVVRCIEAAAGAAGPETWRLCDSLGSLDDGLASVEIADRIGRVVSTVAVHQLHLSGRGRSRGADIKHPDFELPEPLSGLRATRTLRIRGAVGGRPVAFSWLARTRLAALAPWRIIGPFPWRWDRSITEQSASPERGGWSVSDRHDGLSWIEAVASNKWAVDFRAVLGVENGLGYALARITCTRPQVARLVVDSSDKFEAFLNGERVYSQDGFHTDAAAAGGAPVSLRAGVNMLLVKCASGGGGWGFTASLDGDAPVIVEDPGAPGDLPRHPAAG